MANGRNKNKVNKNAGFSLVELLIAVTILAIIVIPLLRLFVTSTRINVKSRQTLRATTVAQDIMEGLKAYNIDELREQFNDPSAGFYVVDARLVKGYIKEETSLEVDDSTGDPGAGIYFFSMSDVTLQGSRYDALIKVDAREYYEDGSHDNDFNNGSVAKIGGLSINGKDGAFSENIDLRRTALIEAYDKFESEHDNLMTNAGIASPNTPPEDEDAPNKLTYKTPGLQCSRVYTVEIEDSGDRDSEGNIIADARTTVIYEFSYNGQGVEVEAANSPCSFTSGNFYLFYYPLYESDVEEIVFENPDKLPLRLSIVKQLDTETDMMTPTDAQLKIAESGYHVDVDIEGNNDDIQVRTNLGTSLVSDRYLGAEGENRKIPGQVSFYLNGSPQVKSMNIYSLSGARDTDLGTAGTDDEITELIYDVEVAVYQEGAAAKGFPEEERMVLISGSKNN